MATVYFICLISRLSHFFPLRITFIINQSLLVALGLLLLATKRLPF